MNPIKTYFKKLNLSFFAGSACIALCMCACTPEEHSKPLAYDGPLREVEDITLYHTEKNRMKVVLKAKKINELQNGDQEFPEGIFIEFYDDLGKITSTLRANSAYHFKAEDKWRGLGDVVVINIEKKQQLNTEELFWKQSTKKIFTEKFVTIKLENEILFGTGFEADQDLSNYKMKNPEGEFEVED
ncbi:MAG: export transporter periplasmic protein LptC [Bacteroidota bacterium]|jgi:LPS export ABC transporter protein LptC